MFNFIGAVEFTMHWVLRLVNVSYFNVSYDNLLTVVILKSNYVCYKIGLILEINTIVKLITFHWYFIENNYACWSYVFCEIWFITSMR